MRSRLSENGDRGSQGEVGKAVNVVLVLSLSCLIGSEVGVGKCGGDEK